MNQKTFPTPLVSLVIPVYNAMPYLIEALEALDNQGLSEEQLEVVLVNDGSDDGSETVLAEYAAMHPNYRVIDQPNSGGPADPCNKGIAAVTGKYFFVVGADDVLTENALGDLAAYAEEHGSDIVLAKMAGLNGRHAPGSMFKASKPEAHLVDDRLFNSLTAIKLFRTDLVAKTGAHNPTHLRIGSDQPFTAACYLAAKKISVRGDRPYVMIRKRDDGKNVTSRPRTATEYSDLLTAVVDVIIRWSEPGSLRDGILHRPIHGAMRKALLPRFLDVDAEEQERIVLEMQRVVGPHFNDVVAAHLGSLDRVKARLALAGRLDDVRELIRWEKDDGVVHLAHDENGFHLDLPDRLVERIGRELLHDVKVVGVATLENVDVEGEVLTIESSAYVRDASVPPDEVVLRARLRDTDRSFDIPVHNSRSVTLSSSPGIRFRADLDWTGVEDGVWDLLVVQRFEGDELENRLGRNRSEHLHAERRPLLDREKGREAGVAYFTKGFGNLSLDIGYTLLARKGPVVSVSGVIDLGSGRHLAFLRAAEPSNLQISLLRSGAPADGVADARSVLLADGLIAIAVPTGCRRIRVADLQESRVLTLPAAVAAPGAATQSSPRSEHSSGPLRLSGLRRPSSLVRKMLQAGRDAARRLGIRRPRFFRRR